MSHKRVKSKKPVYRDEQKALMIKQARKLLRLTQRDFADLFFVQPLAISYWERGHRIPQRPNWELFLLKMAEKGIKFDTSGKVSFDIGQVA